MNKGLKDPSLDDCNFPFVGQKDSKTTITAKWVFLGFLFSGTKGEINTFMEGFRGYVSYSNLFLYHCDTELDKLLLVPPKGWNLWLLLNTSLAYTNTR